jgi:hypothetical protein
MMQYRIDSAAEPTHALKLARAGLEALYDAVPKTISFAADSQLSALKAMLTWPIESFVSFAKYWTVYPLAAHLRKGGVVAESCRTALPVKPEGFQGNPLVYTGPIRRMLKARINSRPSPTVEHLLVNLQQGVKRGAEVVPPSFIEAAMVKHRRTLMKSDDFEWSYQTQFEVYARRFFKAMTPSRIHLKEASTSASYENPRSRGGARGWIRSALRGRQEPVSGSHFCCEIREPEEYLYGMYEAEPGRVVQVRTDIPVEEVERLAAQVLRNVGESSTPVNVQVSAVLEPLKVRLITKSEALPTWLSRFFQASMWRYMQTLPQLALTGRTLDKSDLYGILEREKRLSLDFPYWVSGDYAGATDSLKQSYSVTAFEAVADRAEIDPTVRGLLQKLIYPQHVEYPRKYRHNPALAAFVQTRGQLMGSTMSFPILCAVNLITYWSALEEYLGRRVERDDLPVLVNGDDILFRADSRLYAIWARNVHECGFEFSLGKNYVHPSFLTVNSTAFMFRNGCFIEVPFLNVGLLTGQSKLMTGSVTFGDRPLRQSYEIVVRGAFDKVRAHHRFLHYNRDMIEAATSKGLLNLFGSEDLGGLGFTDEAGVDYHLTGFQRKLGSFLYWWQTSPYTGYFEDTSQRRSLHGKDPNPRVPSWRKSLYGTFRMTDIYAPLRQMESEVPELLHHVGILGGSLDVDRSEMIYRPVDRSILRAMRMDMTKLLSKRELCHTRLRYVRVRDTPLAITNREIPPLADFFRGSRVPTPSPF